ncbi:hypothetical protein ABR737_01285 [Streptomyces sp. Edi2]|uniref:hypothetical protein n=1 Tax=Streptomyces sp. Edi2 TaxID=3162528 RepID=UPI00330673A0
MTSTTESRAVDCATYIREHATPEELEILQGLGKLRREVVWTVRGSLVRIGTTVELCNMRPKYLNGLVGTVASTGKNRKGETFANLTLEPTSSARLAKSRRGGGPTDVLEGIPLVALRPRS